MKRARHVVLVSAFLALLAAPSRQVLAQPRPPLPLAFAVGGNPVDVAVNPGTHTAYVTNGNDATASIVDTTHCRAGDTSGCSQQWPTAALGQGPVNDAVNPVTDTLYVTNIVDNTVSVINGATCNASTRTNCAQTVVPVGAGPDYLAIDEATNTIYVTNNNNGGPAPGTVSIINGNTCDAANASGCKTTPASVIVGVNPIGMAFDPVSHTVYVANAGDQTGAGTLSMIDTSACNASTSTGCPATAPTAIVPKGAGWVDVSVQTDTVYVSGIAAGDATNRTFVSVIDGSTCNGHTTSGCPSVPPVVKVGSIPIGLVADQATQSVFVANQEDSTVSVVDGAICNARHTRGCDQAAPSAAVGFDPGTPGIDPSTGTLYVPSQNENNVYILDVDACTLDHPSGCRHAAPATTVGTGPQGIAVDHTTGTIYVGDRSDNAVSVINGAICNGNRTSGCSTLWPTVATDASPQALAVDGATDTLYTSNNSGTVSVIDITHCNASHMSACKEGHSTVTISTKPDRLRSIAVDDAVHTVYLTDGNGNRLAMINTATCNGTNSSGCGASPATVAVGDFPDGLVIDPATQTVYAANWHSATVSVIDATTCNAQITSGCGGTHPAIPVGKRPNLMAFNPATNTLYVTNADSGTVSVIDATTCNAKNTSGCGQTAATIDVSSPDIAQGAPSPFGIGVDTTRDIVYITSVVDSDVMVIDGMTCNGKITSGCNQPLALIPVGGWPTGLVIDLSLDAAYIPQNVDGETSIVKLLHARAGATGEITQRTGAGTQSSFTVVFDSSVVGQGLVLFGSGPGCSGLVETATQDQGAGTTSHMIRVQGNDLPGTVGDNGIQPGATYWYEAVTVTKTGTELDNNGGKCYSVTVPPR